MNTGSLSDAFPAEPIARSWKPREIIVHRRVAQDPVTRRILECCPGVPVRWVDAGRAAEVMAASRVLAEAGQKMLDRILAGKSVLFVTPAGPDVVDVFEMPDARMVCPHFDRLKLASNGCFYRCDWCYLKLTYRAAFPFITVRTEYPRIMDRLGRRLAAAPGPLIFNSCELADSMALEHLTGAAQAFVPWFARRPGGYLFMLTKSDNVQPLLDLDHNGHTVMAWSLNAPEVSRRFEVGAPPLSRRLNAAVRVRQAGYPLRLRMDPIVPLSGWQDMYRRTINEILAAVQPERITLGTLRFEPGFFRLRRSLLTSGKVLLDLMEGMAPMFPPLDLPGRHHPVQSKYSFAEEKRAEIFRFAVDQIRQRSDCRIALCKESAAVWRLCGLEPDRCSCVCQL